MSALLASDALSRAEIHYWKFLNQTQKATSGQQEPPSNCEVCSRIIHLLDGPILRQKELTLTKEELRKSEDCMIHPQLLPSIGESIEPILLQRPADQRCVNIRPDPYNADDDAAACKTAWEQVFLEDHTDDRVPEGYSQPCRIDEQWIKSDTLRDWITTCQREHVDTCSSSGIRHESIHMPMMLIDCHAECLYLVHEPVEYVTLSYVWGGRNTFLTTTKNVDALCTSRALSKISHKLPKTISQAIALTSVLGQRYLWVDSLCIVQDAEDKSMHLNAMASIFANASLTIVAAGSSHADSGFTGLKDISAPRQAHQHCVELSSCCHLIKPHARHIWTNDLIRPWSTRAWTFQEAICSRRLLYLAYDTVRWTCRKSRWSEESTSLDCVQASTRHEQRKISLASPQLSLHCLPDIDEFLALINGYNMRKLTYPEDALDAFAGVAARLSDHFRGGLICGLPELFFDLCLLWRPSRRLPVMKRVLSFEDSKLSSWSWLAYETEVDFPYSWMLSADQSGPVPILFGNVRPFFSVNVDFKDTNGKWQHINAAWLSDASDINGRDVPAGWRSFSMSSARELRPFGDVFKCVYFTHESRPHTKFWFPVPLGDGKRGPSDHKYIASTPHTAVTLSIPKSPKFLRFYATCGQFRFGKTHRLVTQVLTLNGEGAGNLYQHDETDIDFVIATSGSSGERPTIELTAILGNTIPDEDFDIWHDPLKSALGKTRPRHRHKNPQLFRARDVYNVMWIKRINGVCYRKATGVVDRYIWEANALEETEIVLG